MSHEMHAAPTRDGVALHHEHVYRNRNTNAVSTRDTPTLSEIPHLSGLMPLSSGLTHLPPPRPPFYREFAFDPNPCGHCDACSPHLNAKTVPFPLDRVLRRTFSPPHGAAPTISWPGLPSSSRFRKTQLRCNNGGGTANRWMRSRIAANNSRGIVSPATRIKRIPFRRNSCCKRRFSPTIVAGLAGMSPQSGSQPIPGLHIKNARPVWHQFRRMSFHPPEAVASVRSDPTKMSSVWRPRTRGRTGHRRRRCTCRCS